MGMGMGYPMETQHHMGMPHMGMGMHMMDPQMMMMMGIDPMMMAAAAAAVMDPRLALGQQQQQQWPANAKSSVPIVSKSHMPAPHGLTEDINGRNDSNQTQDFYTLRCSDIPANIREEELVEHFTSFGDVVDLVFETGTGNVVLSISYRFTSRIHKFNCIYTASGDDSKNANNECLVQFLKPISARSCLSSPRPVLNNRFIKLSQNTTNIADVTTVTYPKYKSSAREKNIGHVKTRDEVTEKAKQLVNDKVKKQYEDLKDLRTQASNVLTEKIRLVQEQLDQNASMLTKLESKPYSDTKRKMMDEIEGKIVNLQVQLHSLKEQKENPISAPSPNHARPNNFSGRTGGRIGGRMGGRSGRAGRFPGSRTTLYNNSEFTQSSQEVAADTSVSQAEGDKAEVI